MKIFSIFVSCILRFWPIFKNLKIFENGSKMCAKVTIFGFFWPFCPKWAKGAKIWYFDPKCSILIKIGHFAWLMVRGIFSHFWKNCPLHRHTKFKND